MKKFKMKVMRAQRPVPAVNSSKTGSIISMRGQKINLMEAL
jgi:hypothetical protein